MEKFIEGLSPQGHWISEQNHGFTAKFFKKYFNILTGCAGETGSGQILLQMKFFDEPINAVTELAWKTLSCR